MLNYLKIKIVSLTEEAKLIRKDENKRLANATDLRAKGKDIKEAYNLQVYTGLREHRVGIVREEARAANIAMGFLRGHEYNQIERISYTQPDWMKIKNLVERYGEDRTRVAEFDEWKKRALYGEGELPNGGVKSWYSNRGFKVKPRSVNKYFWSWPLRYVDGSVERFLVYIRQLFPLKEKVPYVKD